MVRCCTRVASSPETHPRQVFWRASPRLREVSAMRVTDGGHLRGWASPEGVVEALTRLSREKGVASHNLCHLGRRS